MGGRRRERRGGVGGSRRRVGAPAGARHRRLEEVLSDAQTQTGAVAGLAIRIHRAPVPDRLEGFQTQLDEAIAIVGGASPGFFASQ